MLSELPAGITAGDSTNSPADKTAVAALHTTQEVSEELIVTSLEEVLTEEDLAVALATITKELEYLGAMGIVCLRLLEI